jgi:hypothetical protein
MKSNNHAKCYIFQNWKFNVDLFDIVIRLRFTKAECSVVLDIHNNTQSLEESVILSALYFFPKSAVEDNFNNLSK